jgi:NAD+ synthase (glutamine-hydrolysing)
MPRPVHLAVVQFKPKKGDYAANLARLGPLFARIDALEPRPAVAHFPETALTGYFVEGGVRDLAIGAGALAADLDRVYRTAVPSGRALDVVIGFYEIWRNRLHNSAMYVTLGADGGPRIRHVHRKLFLPTYGLFDEERFVERGHEVCAFDAPWGRAALLVCEDAWHSITATIAALAGAQVIFLSAAAPARGAWPRADDTPGPASLQRWERLARDIAEEHGVYVSLAHLVGNEAGKTFAGGSMVAGPKGDVRARAPLWDEAILSISLDPADITHARADMPLLSDLETMLPHLLPQMGTASRNGDRAPAFADDEAPEEGEADAPRPHRTVGADEGSAAGSPAGVCVVRVRDREHGGPPPLGIDEALTADWLVHFVRDEVHRRGFAKAIVGVSGGVDSAVTAYLAARALGPQNVVGVRMPYRTSSSESLEHAQLVIDALGIEARTVDISPAVDGYLTHEPEADPTRRGNIMARMRMIALFDLSARYRALPLGTGNKTERLFGYFTWHADDSPPINPLGDLFKTQVWALARHLGVPEPIVAKPPSADLVVGQTDEGDFGISYGKADELLNWMLAGWSPAELAARGFAAAEVELVRRRLAGTHWKRRLPTVAMVSPTAIGESYLRPVDY